MSSSRNSRRRPAPAISGKRVVLCASGASGAHLTRRFLTLLLAHPEVAEVHFTASSSFWLVWEREEGKRAAAFWAGVRGEGKLQKWAPEALDAPVASGSYPVTGTVLLPASAATVGAVASGAGRDLSHRCAEVALKEGRPLLVVPRETPMSLILLRNLATLREAGALIAPFVPAYYQGATTLREVEDHFLMRLMDHLGLDTALSRRWDGT